MIDPVRQEVLTSAHTVVVKVGTNVLTDADGVLSRERIQSLADQLQRIRGRGKRVVLVSSGAIGAGVGRLGLGKRPSDLRHLQACAAIGQSLLMRGYEECLAPHGVPTAQLLLTAGDFDSRSRYLNVRNTLLALFEWGCLPIINENDTVSVDEIRFGDNDHLAALVTNLLQAPLLILLTSADGLYPRDPSEDPTLKPLSIVPMIDEAILEMAGSSRSSLGTGGMRSKLRSARLATAAGESVVIANGNTPSILDAIFSGEAVGTLFLPHGGTMPAWKRWLGLTARPRGRLHVDAGARRAIENQGRSLLAIGIVRLSGNFDKGDVLAICGPDGVEFARGLCNYSAVDVERIRGLKTDRIGEILGTLPYDEVVHRDNLVIVV